MNNEYPIEYHWPRVINLVYFSNRPKSAWSRCHDDQMIISRHCLINVVIRGRLLDGVGNGDIKEKIAKICYYSVHSMILKNCHNTTECLSDTVLSRVLTITMKSKPLKWLERMFILWVIKTDLWTSAVQFLWILILTAHLKVATESRQEPVCNGFPAQVSQSKDIDIVHN